MYRDRLRCREVHISYFKAVFEVPRFDWNTGVPNMDYMMSLRDIIPMDVAESPTCLAALAYV